MTNNEFLRELYETFGPEYFKVEFAYGPNGGWFQRANPLWVNYGTYRLVPVVPEGCNPAPEEACVYGTDRRGAICLQGPWDFVDRFRGWAWSYDPEMWSNNFTWAGDADIPYLIRLSDPNATKIVYKVTGKRLPWYETERCLEETRQSDLPDMKEIKPNSLTIKHKGPIRIDTQDGVTKIEWVAGGVE